MYEYLETVREKTVSDSFLPTVSVICLCNWTQKPSPKLIAFGVWSSSKIIIGVSDTRFHIKGITLCDIFTRTAT